MFTSSEPGGAAYDAALPYPVVRDRAGMLLPTPRATSRAVRLARRYDCDRVWFGAAAPLGLMAQRLRREAGIRRLVATTHGHEVWWAWTPGARGLLRRIGESVDTLTYLGPSTREPIAAALGHGRFPGTPGPGAPKVTAAGRTARLERLVPGVDAAAFHPRAAAGERDALRERYGLGDRPVVLCAARLVARKGQDTLIQALPRVRAAVPGTRLLLVGSGPYERALRRTAAAEGMQDYVVFAGGHPHGAMPRFYAAADVFAMPCRTRKGGLEVEGLGIVYLEAAAAGLPVLAGDSGGAPDAVRDGETGHVVDGRRVDVVADRLVRLLRDRETAREMGRKGRDWVRTEWDWDRSYERLAAFLG
ncbi:glycosyltransferase family 4 protein [Streptomyces sp. NPDC088124]|uniref:glycosyltransferase family 4 protein n=1 Tax=Streptomyces sp. NPDC088124 TaxID=3154654 RepID=UPI00341608AA